MLCSGAEHLCSSVQRKSCLLARASGQRKRGQGNVAIGQNGMISKFELVFRLAWLVNLGGRIWKEGQWLNSGIDMKRKLPKCLTMAIMNTEPWQSNLTTSRGSFLMRISAILNKDDIPFYGHCQPLSFIFQTNWDYKDVHTIRDALEGRTSGLGISTSVSGITWSPSLIWLCSSSIDEGLSSPRIASLRSEVLLDAILALAENVMCMSREETLLQAGGFATPAFIHLCVIMRVCGIFHTDPFFPPKPLTRIQEAEEIA